MKIQTATTPTPSTQTASSGQLQGTKDEFLKLFMAQLQHQDPLDPSSGADMVAQLAQFSSVEQQAQTNQQLQDLAAAQASTASASMSSLVGRQCDATAGDFTIAAGGSPPPISLSSTGSMKGASLVITDDSGKEVRRIPAPDAKSATLAWDGKDASGNPVQPGKYHIAVDGGGSAVTATWHGRIDAVELTPDGPRLRMGDVLLTPASITTIGATTSAIPNLGALQ